tara:strand:+ start:374 stop:493 length:120 start_codon:yes stop_codon:yes gene_type:complete
VEEDKVWALDYYFAKKKVTGIRYFIDEVIQDKLDVYEDF